MICLRRHNLGNWCFGYTVTVLVIDAQLNAHQEPVLFENVTILPFCSTSIRTVTTHNPYLIATGTTQRTHTHTKEYRKIISTNVLWTANTSSFIPIMSSVSIILSIPFNHLSFKNFVLQFLDSIQSNNMCLTSSSPQHNGHLTLSVFLLIPFNCHTPASSHAVPHLFFP